MADISHTLPFRILTHLEEGLLLPDNTLVDVGSGVREALSLAGLATEETVEVGSDLVGAALLEGVALSATGLEEVGTLGSVTWALANDSSRCLTAPEGLQACQACPLQLSLTSAGSDTSKLQASSPASKLMHRCCPRPCRSALPISPL